MADAGAVDINSHSRAELDTLYSPSCWSKKLNRDVIVDNHLKVITEGTKLTLNNNMTRYVNNFNCALVPYHCSY